MKTITVDIDVGLWLNEKGQVLLFVNDDPKEYEMIPLIDLLRMCVNSHKTHVDGNLDWEDIKRFTKLKKALLNCTAYLTTEMLNAK